MIAEIGLAALWLAAALAVLQMVSGGFALRSVEGAPNPMAIYARPAAVVQAVLAVMAFILLLYAFAVTDLSIKLVATNSHSMKPMIYKLTGTWGNHEGSMLLWVGVLALSGGLLAAFEKRLPERTMGAALGVQGFVALGFYAFLLFSSNPFERLPVPAVEGVGLNPLLQDIGLAIHPPTLYAGYVGLSVAFSLAMGALLTKEVNPSFARVMRPWVLGAWVLLTFGITAGSYWAYYELGWGGWWFWDPVENASLMPWLAAALAVAAVLPLKGRKLTRVPSATWGMVLAHFGVAVSLFGMACEGAFTQERLAAVAPGGTEQVGDFAVTLQSVTPVAGPNWTAIEARLAVSQNGGEPVILSPQARNFWSPPQATSESALLTRWNGQLYAVIGNQAEDGRWQIRVWWKPFVTFIWYGGLLIALGGVLAIAGRVKVDVKRRKATAMGDARRADLEALGAAAPVPAE